MDVVEKTKSVCRICYLHGKIADIDTPISSATPRLPVIHYHTMPMKWPLNPEIRWKIQGGLSTPNVRIFFTALTHQTHKAELTIQCKSRHSTAQHYLYTATVLPTLYCSPGLGRIFFQFSVLLPNQRVLPDLAPHLKGHTHTHDQACYTPQDCNTHHNWL